MHKEIQLFVPGFIARIWKSQDLNLGSLAPESMLVYPKES